MRRNKADASIFLLIAIVVLLAAGIVFAVFFLRQDPIEETLSGDRVVNTLFIIENNQKPIGSYLLMYYPATRRAAIFDVPGELGLIIKRINRVDRIDTVYDSGKIATYEQEIAGLLGVEINFSMIVTIENLGKIVDLIGGVELFIPSAVEIYNTQQMILFPSGLSRLDGDKARLYVTYEIPEEDREMGVFRRQRFLLGFLKRLGEVNSELKNPGISLMYQSFFKTDMNQHNLLRLFDEFSAVDTDRTSIQSVGGNIREVSGQTLLFPYYDGSLIKEIVRQSLGSLTRQLEGSLSERVFTVEVRNGTGLNGLAGRTAELLRGFGYDVLAIGNAERDDYEKTEIIDRSGYEDMVKIFSDIIHCTNIKQETLVRSNPEGELTMQNLELQNLEYHSDFTLIIGRDFNGRYVIGQ